MGTSKNCLNEAVETSTLNLCSEQKYEKDFRAKNYSKLIVYFLFVGIIYKSLYECVNFNSEIKVISM